MNFEDMDTETLFALMRSYTGAMTNQELTQAVFKLAEHSYRQGVLLHRLTETVMALSTAPRCSCAPLP